MTTRRPRLPPLPKDWPASTAKAFRAWQRAVARLVSLPAWEIDTRARDAELDRLNRAADRARSALRYLSAADAERIDDSIATITRDGWEQFQDRRRQGLRLRAETFAAGLRPRAELSAAERQYRDELRTMIKG